MSVVYPVEIKQYRVSVGRRKAEVLLQGVEGPVHGASTPSDNLRHVGRITFGDPKPISDNDFVNRGGILQMDRSLAMFSAILDLLRNENPLFLNGDGTLSTSLEPVGEARG